MYQQSIYSSLYFKNDNVGIGTATPLSKLHIHGDIQLSSNVRVYTLSDGKVYVDDLLQNVTHVLNPLTSKGDIGVHDGTKEVRLPVGTNNMVLISDDSTQTGLAWIPMSNIQGTSLSTILTEKGDLLVYDGNTEARLPVGPNNTILISDSSTSTGLAWIPLSNVQGSNTSSGSLTILQGGVGIDTLYANRIYADAIYTPFETGVSNIFTDTLSVTYVQNFEGQSASIENIDTQTVTAATLYASNVIYREEPTILSISYTQIENTTFTKVHSWIHQGASEKVRNPLRFLTNAYIQSPCNVVHPDYNYTLRIMDVSHNIILGQITASNILPSIQSIPTTSIPRSNIDVELQAKKGVYGDYVVIESLTAEYGELSGNLPVGAFGAYQGDDFVIRGNAIPSSNLHYDLGSASNRWRDLYLSGDTIDLGGVRISKAESGTGIQVVDQQNQPLATSASELIATGNVGIGTSLPNAKLHIVYSNGDDVLRIEDVSSSNTSMVIRNDGNIGIGTSLPSSTLFVEGTIGVNGDVFSTGSLTAFAFSTLSDQNWKEDIRPIENVLSKIRTLRPVDFVWSCNLCNEHIRGTPDIGLIAQEVEPIIPKIMRDYTPPGNAQRYKGIAYEKLTPYLVKAVQELDAEVSHLRSLVNDLLNKK